MVGNWSSSTLHYSSVICWSNYLAHLPILVKCNRTHQPTILHLLGCQLTNLDFMMDWGLSQLQILDFDNNQLSSLKESLLIKMPNLISLYLNNNCFQNVPNSLSLCSQLMFLKLSNNSLHRSNINLSG